MTCSVGSAWMGQILISTWSALCRTIFAPVASAMTCLVAVLSAFTNLRWLLGCAMAFGFVFGWHWSLMPVRSTWHLPLSTISHKFVPCRKPLLGLLGQMHRLMTCDNALQGWHPSETQG